VSPPVILTWLSSAAARRWLRRAIPRARARLVSCRSAAQLERALAASLTDAIVVDGRLPGGAAALARVRSSFPGVPRFVYSAFRPGDGRLLANCVGLAAASPIVEGVEDTVAGELVLPRTATAQRLGALDHAPRLLRLTDALQVRAWAEVMRRVGGRLRATDVARALHVSREHLSRQFGAGGAPNLKRVIDLARVATAADLLANPGYSVGGVARLLGFASASHLSGASRRVAGVTARALPVLGPRGVLSAFLSGRTRSRR
jgi:AraC-like DNA-binding protein